MFNIDIYNKKIDNNNMTYSVDMLRLKTYISYSDFSEIEFMINTSLKDNVKKFWVSDRIMCFHYNYVLEFDGNSFWFGFMHNNENISYNKENLSYNFTIEFNPNKLKDNSFIIHILSKFSNWIIKSFDLAIDIPVNILDLIVDIRNRKNLETYSCGKDNITYRFGSGDRKVKIYNKKIESDLNIVGYLTRVEVSVKLDDFYVSKIKTYKFDEFLFPYIYLNQYIFSFSDYTTKDKTTLALLYAVQSGYPIKELTRTYREKIYAMLEIGSRVKFSSKIASEILKQTIYYYFVRRDSKQIIF